MVPPVCTDITSFIIGSRWDILCGARPVWPRPRCKHIVYTGWPDSFLAPLPPAAPRGPRQPAVQRRSNRQRTEVWEHKAELSAPHLENLPAHTQHSWPPQHRQERESKDGGKRKRHFLLPCYRHQVREKKMVFCLEQQIKIHSLDWLSPCKMLALDPFPALGDQLKVKGILLHSKTEHWLPCPLWYKTDQDGKPVACVQSTGIKDQLLLWFSVAFFSMQLGGFQEKHSQKRVQNVKAIEKESPAWLNLTFLILQPCHIKHV